MMTSHELRERLRADDIHQVRELVQGTEFFSSAESDVAAELVTEALARGVASGYHFVLLDEENTGKLIAYTCYGEIACTVGSWDLYWIAVHRDWQRQGLGSYLLGATEQRIARQRGRHLYVETSGRRQYAPTRSFYRAHDYALVAELADFYGPDDPKLIYRKMLGGAT